MFIPDYLRSIHTRPMTITLDSAVVGETHDAIKQKQLIGLGQLILDTNEYTAMYSRGQDGFPLPVRKSLYDAMMSGDFTRISRVMQAEEGRG